MKTLFLYLLFFCLAFQIGCKTRYNTGFVKATKESDIALVNIASPYVNFILESKDTLRFNSQDIVSLISGRLSKEVKRWGYVSSKHLASLEERLKNVKSDTVVHQNLSAVGIVTISDNLDSWMARELLLEGKAEIAMKDKQPAPIQLKYVYAKDILGGEQGAFYTNNKKLVYRTIISFGE